MSDSPQYLALVLHAHLPMIESATDGGHPLESVVHDWCADALLPLLDRLHGLERDRVAGRLTLSLSTTLMAMLDGEAQRERFEQYLERRIALCDRECERTASRHAFSALAQWHRSRYADALKSFRQDHDRDLVGALAKLHRSGRLELITAVSTHPLVPLVGRPELIHAHVRLTIDAFGERLGSPPAGMWLPECAYCDDVATELARQGVRYTVVSPSALRPYQLPRDPVLNRPIAARSGLALFARDVEAARELTGTGTGFAAEPRFLERRLSHGVETVAGELRGLALSTRWIDDSLSYFGFAGTDGRRQTYQPDLAEHRARERARLFVSARQHELMTQQSPDSPAPPIATVALDSQLLGLWWFEGPAFVDEVFRSSAASPLDIVTPSDYLNQSQPLLLRQPESTTWGRGGFLQTWLDEDSEWIYRHIHITEARLLDAVARWRPEKGSWRYRSLAQAARELLLSQTSDWASLLGRHRLAGYAAERIEDHLAAANRLITRVDQDHADEPNLALRERLWPIFPNLDLSVFRAD